MKNIVFIHYIFKDGYECWSGKLSAAELKRYTREHGRVVRTIAE